MQDDLDKCILELQKPEAERDIPIIVKYIQTLKGFINILHDTGEEFNFYLNEISKILRYTQRNKDEVIVEQGNRGDSFFLILKGSVTFLVARPYKIEVTKEDYLLHLMKLRKNHSNELLRQTIQTNNNIYSIDESFDQFIKNIVFHKTKGGEFLDNKFICQKARELYDFINDNQNNKNTNFIISIDEYIKRNEFEVIQEENPRNKFYRFDDTKKEKEKKIVSLFNFKTISKCYKGETFGELALEQNTGKRQATVITNEPTDFAIIYRKEYNDLLKNSIDKAKKHFFSVINNYNIFNEVTPYALDKKYYKLFNLRKFEKGYSIIEQNTEQNSLYFIVNGEYEISTTRNIKEVNDLIIYYKKYIRKHGNKQDYKVYKPIEEERENDDLNLNKKYKSEEQNNILFEKRFIKLNILQERDIIGLNNLMIPINHGSSKSLINCKVLGTNSQVYELEINQFNFICEVEDGVKNYTIDYEINKMKMLIKRLEDHKKRVYDIITKKEIEASNEHNKMRLIKLEKNQKNRLHFLEANQVLESLEMRTFIEKMEKEKEMRRKMREKEIEKERKKLNSFALYKRNQILLPKINHRNSMLRQFLKSKDKSKNEAYYEQYKDDLKHNYLYESVFNSYAFTQPNKNKLEIKSSRLNKSKNGIYDALILDRFNSCYAHALINLNK